jgi:hypothetical protein
MPTNCQFSLAAYTGVQTPYHPAVIEFRNYVGEV